MRNRLLNEKQKSPVLACKGLRKRFGEIEAVRGVSFEIAPGESYGLLGPNGAGKTTTISIVAGLLEADAGEALVEGKLLTTKSVAAKSAIGFVPQDLAIYPDLTARENLSFFARLYGIKGKQNRRRVGEVLEIIGLEERAGDQAKTYSGGMKRRLNIGIGLLHSPSLLILDEPTVGVDPQSRNAILESVEQLGEQGMAVLYTTHYMEEAERLCDRVGIIDQGSMVACGTVDELRKGGRERRWVDVPAAPDGWEPNVPGTRLVQADGSRSLFELDTDVDDQALLQAALATGPVREFVPVEPSLSELFRTAIDEAASTEETK